MGLSKAEVMSYLAETSRVGRLATVSGAGDPHVVPIWFKVDGETLLVHTLAESRKAKNIGATSKYALTVDKDTMPYKGVTVSGRAEVAAADRIDWDPLIRELAVAYVGAEGGPGYGDYIVSMPGEHVTLVLHVDDTEDWDYS